MCWVCSWGYNWFDNDAIGSDNGLLLNRHQAITLTNADMFKMRSVHLNSSDTGDRIFRIRGLLPCLLMPWLLKSPEPQEAWYWLCRTDNIYCCSRVHFTYLGEAKFKIWFKMWTYLLPTLKQFRVLTVHKRLVSNPCECNLWTWMNPIWTCYHCCIHTQ